MQGDSCYDTGRSDNSFDVDGAVRGTNRVLGKLILEDSEIDWK